MMEAYNQPFKHWRPAQPDLPPAKKLGEQLSLPQEKQNPGQKTVEQHSSKPLLANLDRPKQMYLQQQEAQYPLHPRKINCPHL